MHKPPSVEYPAGQSRWLGRAWMVLWCTALAINLVWLVQAASGDWRPWAALVSALIGASATAGPARVRAAGLLAWDGDAWWWAHDGARARGVVTLALDLQRIMLLRFLPDQGPRCWLLVERASDATRWLSLRRAVHGAAGLGHAAGGAGIGDAPERSSDRLIEP